MYDTLSSEEVHLIKTAAAFAAGEIEPYATDWELQRRVPTETFKAAADAGLTGLLVPKLLGGRDASHIAVAKVLEELSQACLAFTFGLWVHNNLVNVIARNGNQHQIDRYLPEMLAGQRVGAFCITEPGTGSDATAISTLAEKVSNGWRLNGEKAWVTNSVCADVFAVYAQTNPDSGWRGIACFLVDGNVQGLERGVPYTMSGGHAMGVSGLRIEDILVPETSMLFGPGDGFKAAMKAINLARTFVAALCCGILKASLEAALTYCAGRQAFGKPILANQGLQWELADVATDLEAARLLLYRAAFALDTGEDAIAESAHAKKFASRVAFTGISQCMQAMGAAGLRTDTPLFRHLATAKMTHYMDGTTEIQNVVISREILKEYGIRAE
jgi:alkylation response protein AidB-like acyl-CoA dehydrogenase